MARTRTTKSTAITLRDYFQQLRPAGAEGFEGLVADLLSDLTGLHFYLSQSGQQSGRDAKTSSQASTVVAIEAKRYADSTKLDERELVAELHQAVTSEPTLDLWILATSRYVPEQLLKSLEKEAEGLAVALLIMDSLPHGNVATGSLGRLFTCDCRTPFSRARVAEAKPSVERDSRTQRV